MMGSVLLNGMLYIWQQSAGILLTLSLIDANSHGDHYLGTVDLSARLLVAITIYHGMPTAAASRPY